jgi:trimethylamine--corrinoid protein Co-methyltransferase
MRVNYRTNATTRFRVLSDDQIGEIVSAALEVLERTGTRVYNEVGLALLEGSGARVSDGNLVRIPSSLVKASLNTAPERIVVAGRDRGKRLILGGNNIHYMMSSDSQFVVDPYTNERRLCTNRDIYDAARIADALPHIDICMAFGSASDVPTVMYHRYHLLAMLRGTSKPLFIECNDAMDLADQYDMACAAVGGEDEFRKAPLFIAFLEPTSPLTHAKVVIDKLFYAVEKGIPFCYCGVSMAGATEPATMAGMLVQNLAQFMTGLVLSQLKKPGASIMMGGTVSAMDMRTSVLAYGAPELSLASAALTDIAKWLRLPMMSTGGCSDSKVFDQQAAIEQALGIAVAALSGAHVVHNVGYLESCHVGSFDMVVQGNEIISLCKHICRGMRVDKEHLAVDLIDRVGPSGNFLAEYHTLKHFKTEHWVPQLLDRDSRTAWEARGSKSLQQRIREKVIDVLENYQPAPLPADREQRLQEILDRAEQRHRNQEAVELV